MNPDLGFRLFVLGFALLWLGVSVPPERQQFAAFCLVVLLFAGALYDWVCARKEAR